jgi:Na+/H+ antiporter NhaD/arsenite permease-like protein
MIFRRLLSDKLLGILVLAGLILSLFSGFQRFAFLRWVDWPTVCTMAGLMVLTKGIEESGFLEHLGCAAINRLQHQRTLALFLVAATALLSTVLTNDIALFVVVPLTIGLRTQGALPIGRLVIFEALAANAGSLLTPIGNPQNILLWQKSQLSFWRFIAQMTPLAFGVLLLLLALTALVFPYRRIHAEPPAFAKGRQSRLLLICVVLYIGFLTGVELAHPGLSLLILSVCVLIFCRGIVRDVDWSLILVFIAMFVDIHLVTELSAIRGALDGIAHASVTQLFLLGVLGSQVISNVPATILLLKYVSASKMLAYAVNVGGFGLALGSLANLIALRMVKERGVWLRFHLYSMPFLLIAGIYAFAIL